jgi:hypothetical protein
VKKKVALLAALVLGATAGASAVHAATPAAAAISASPAAAAKTCGSGWTHAVIGGQEKCLRAGQFCVRSRDAEYHRYRYHCHKYDASVDRYRLTR